MKHARKERFCRSFFVLQKKDVMDGIVGKAADAEGILASKGSAGGETPVLDNILGKDVMDGLRGGPEGAVDRNRANGMMEGTGKGIAEAQERAGEGEGGYGNGQEGYGQGNESYGRKASIYDGEGWQHGASAGEQAGRLDQGAGEPKSGSFQAGR